MELVLDEKNENWSTNPEQNGFFVQSITAHANELLRIQRYVTGNEILDMLGFEKNEEGALSGWVANSAECVDVSIKKDENGTFNVKLNFNTDNVFRDK